MDTQKHNITRLKRNVAILDENVRLLGSSSESRMLGPIPLPNKS